MKRVIVIALALAVVWVGVQGWSSQAWGMQDPPASVCGDSVTARSHIELRSQLPTHVTEGKMEVLELFTYGCRECDALQPHLSRWLAERPEDVQHVRVPAAWRHVAAHARLFYTLVALHRTDLHQAVFDAIFRQGRLLETADGPEAFREQLAFAREHGISENDFMDAYYSPFVEGSLARAREIARAYCNPDVPTFVINGRLVTNVTRAGVGEALVKVAKTLVAAERARLRKTLPPASAASVCSRPSGDAEPRTTQAGLDSCDTPDAGYISTASH